MRRILKEPFTYLLLQTGCTFLAFALIRGSRLDVSSDSPTYLHFKMDTLADALSQVRTIGYPFFLDLIRLLSPDLKILPYIQFLLFAGAVLLFYRALRVYGVSGWLAVFAASPLLYQRVLWQFGNSIMSDVPAAAFSIISMGLLFIVTARRGGLIAWIGLIIGVFMTYQMRPAYLFMVVIFPVLAVILSALRERPLIWNGSLKRLLVGMSAACFVPLIAFCGLRLATVGHFGLVSFTGVHTMGITTQFLTKDMVDRLDEDLRSWANALIEEREKRNLGVPPGKSMIPMPLMADRSLAYQAMFVDIAWHLMKAPSEAGKSGKQINPVKDAAIKLDQTALRLAFSTMAAKPAIHLVYYAKSFFYGISFTLYAEGSITVLLIVLFGAHMVVTWRQIRASWLPRLPAENGRGRLDFNAILFTGLLFYLANLLLIIAIEPPGGRFLMAAAIFMPSVLAVAICRVVRSGFVLSNQSA